MTEFESFARERAPMLAQFAYLLCGDAGHAEDLVQVSLMKAHRHWSRVRVMENPDAYVRRIVLREFLSWRRRRWTKERVDSDLLAVVVHPDLTTKDPSEGIAGQDLLWQALKTVTRAQRSALVLRYYLDLSDADIAEQLGCSAPTVRTHISRGLQRLRNNPILMTKETVYD